MSTTRASLSSASMASKSPAPKIWLTSPGKRSLMLCRQQSLVHDQHELAQQYASGQITAECMQHQAAGTGHAEQVKLQSRDRGAELMLAYVYWRADLTVVLTGMTTALDHSQA